MKKPLPERLRICFLSRHLPRKSGAAAYAFLLPLCREMARRGHDVSIITTAEGDAAMQTVDGVQVHYLDSPMSPSLNETLLDRLEQLHVEQPFDLVHSVDNTGHVVAPAKKQLGLTLAVDIAGIELDQIFGIVGLIEDTVLSYVRAAAAVTARFLKSFFGADHRLLKTADGIFVTSQQQKDILELYYFISSRRIHVIPYGINTQEMEPEPVVEDPFKRWEIETGTKVVLTVAPLDRIDEIKNLLTAFERVVIKKPKTALLIVGDGPRRKELEFHMLSLALASKVTFTGDLPSAELDELISSCDIYVNLSSKSSGFEPTVLQAMASCKTVIASEVGTSANVIKNGEDGYLLRPTEIAALTRLLLEAVSGQIDVGAIGGRARQKILKLFDTGAMVDETIRAYHAIMLSTGKYRK